MEVVLGKLVGKLGPRMWAQVYDFSPEDEGKIAGRGRLVAVVSMETEEDQEQMEMVQTGREILSRLHEQYFGSEEGSAFETLKNAVTQVRKEFERVEIAGAAMVKNTIYVAASQGSGVFVSTQGKQGWLVKPGSGGESLSAFSGRGSVNEVIVLGNRKFWQVVPEGMIQTAVANAREEMEAGVESLAFMQRGNEAEGGEAGVLIRVAALEEEYSTTGPEVPINEEILPTSIKEESETETGSFRGRMVIAMRNKLPGWAMPGKIYIRHGDRQSQRRNMMFAGVGFLVLLLLMAGVGQVLVKQRNQQNSANETLIEKLTDDFSEARADATLNPPRSRQLLAQIQAEMEQLNNQKVKDIRIDGIQKEYKQVLLDASGIVSLKMTELLNLTLVRPGINGTRLGMDGGKLEVLDGSTGRVIEADIKTGAGSVVAGGDNWKGARIIATYPGKTFVVTDSGIMIVPGNKPAVEIGQNKGNITDMKVYAGNIYLLESADGQILRLNVNAAGGFGSGQSWLTDKNGDEELKQGTGMVIDGSIWVIKSGGLLKFTRGVKDTVTVSGLEKEWGNGAVIFTDDNTKQLYILDPANKRVVVLDKTGQYAKQYISDTLGETRDLTVDENGGKMYFVGETKVWAASL